jgi:hypothetical protein
MALKDLIVPKWKHSRAEVRLASIDSIRHDKKLLAEIAKTDVSPQVRLAAIEHIDDEPLLGLIIESERDEKASECAKKRREEILKKIINTSRDTETVISALEKYNNEKVTASYLCEHDLDSAIQHRLIERIKTPQLLCKITENKCALEIAESILEQISEKELLERIAQKASNKKIRTLAQEKINTLFADPLAEQRAITKKFEQCCSSMEITVSARTIEQAEALLEVSRNLWNRYDPERKHPLAEKYASEEKSLVDKIEHFNQQKQILDSMDSLCRQAEVSVNDSKESLEGALEKLKNSWSSLDRSILTGISTQSLDSRFKSATAIISATIAAGKQAEEQLRYNKDTLDKCCSELEVLVNNTNVHDKKAYQRIITQWESLCQRNAPETTVKARFGDLKKKYQENIDKTAELEKLARQEDIDYVHQLLEEMESYANAKLTQTGALQGKAARTKKEWGKFYPHARTIKKGLESRFAAAFETFMNNLHEFREQSSWQQWANENAREKLLADIEQLEIRLQEENTLQHLARKVSLFESQWKRASGGNSDKNRELDERFIAICNRIFTLGLNKKTALLEKLQCLMSSGADKDSAEEVKSVQKQWNDIGYLPPEIEKDLPDTFYSLCNSFFEQRKEQYQKYHEDLDKNKALREAICEEAEKLTESTDWKNAKEAFTQLQQRWDESWPAPQKRSQELWQQFSKSRTQFFERYDSFKTNNDTQKEELCTKAEHLLERFQQAGIEVQPETIISEDSSQTESATSIEQSSVLQSPVNYNSILNEAISLQKTWKETGPASKNRSEELWQRFNNALQQIFTQINEIHSKNLSSKEELVKEAEALTESNDWDAASARFSEIRAAWKTIGSAARRDEQALWNRLQTAGDSFFGRRRAHFDTIRQSNKEQLAERETLLAEMEILVRIAGKGHMLKTDETQSAAEILKKGMELRDKYEVTNDPQKTYENIRKRAQQIIDIWDSGEQGNNRENYQLNRQFDSLLRILDRQ